MRLFKLMAVLVISAALAAIGAASASAFMEFLPGKAGTPFTDLSGPASLVTKNVKGELLKVDCKKSKSTGELTSSTTATDNIDFEGCTAAGGLPANTDPDASGIILVKANVKTCAITEAPLKGGILIKLAEAVTILVPAVKLTITVTGDLIAGLTPENTLAELFTAKITFNAADVQEFKTCKDTAGGSALTEELKAKVDAEPELAAAEKAQEGLIQFTKANAQTFDA